MKMEMESAVNNGEHGSESAGAEKTRPQTQPSRRVLTLRNGIKTLVAVAVLGNAVYDGYFPNEKVTEFIGDDGEIEYVHSDPKTQHILNYLSGKESLSDEDVRDIWIDNLETICNEKKLPFPKDIQTWRLEDIKKFIADNDPKYYELSGGTKETVQQRPFHREYYDALWKAVEDNGSPKIRWGAEKWLGTGYDAKSMFNDFTHTVHLVAEPIFKENSEDKFVDRPLFAEIAHAKQFHEHREMAAIRFTGSVVRLVYNKIFTGGSWSKNYGLEYKRVGSLEHEAHEEIEPALLQQVQPIFHSKPETVEHGITPFIGEENIDETMVNNGNETADHEKRSSEFSDGENVETANLCKEDIHSAQP